MAAIPPSPPAASPAREPFRMRAAFSAVTRLPGGSDGSLRFGTMDDIVSPTVPAQRQRERVVVRSARLTVADVKAKVRQHGHTTDRRR